MRVDRGLATAGTQYRRKGYPEVARAQDQCPHPWFEQKHGANQHAKYPHCKRCGARSVDLGVLVPIVYYKEFRGVLRMCVYAGSLYNI